MSGDRICVTSRQLRLRIEQLRNNKLDGRDRAFLLAALEDIVTAFDSQERFWEDRFSEQAAVHRAEVAELERRYNEQIRRLSGSG